MIIFYNLFIFLYHLGIKVKSKKDKKAKLFLDGRNHFLQDLKKLSSLGGAIWFHVSSLGEFEQARPLIEKIKKENPQQKIVISFFSPSGYEIRKNYDLANFVFYLPIDNKKNAENLFQFFHPKMIFFVKYDLWYHFINQASKKQIPLYLIGASFRENQIYFKWYGSFFKGIIKKFDFIFTLNRSTLELLSKNGFRNILFAGDPRIDRVFSISKENSTVFFIEEFLQSSKGFVVGSGYLKEAEMVKLALDNNVIQSKVIFAPHNVSKEFIQELVEVFKGYSVELFSEYKNAVPKILIIDMVGLLNKIYKYSYCTLIGGGFGNSIHNILEPAAFGNFILFGPNHHKFNEANDLIKLGGAVEIQGAEDLLEILKTSSEVAFLEKGLNSKKYIQDLSGATDIIYSYIDFHSK